MKLFVLSIALVLALSLFAEASKENCACPTGSACTCPEGKCVCASPAEPKAESKNCGCACCEGKDVCCCHAGESTGDAAAAAGHPLKGIVVDVLPDKQSLLVKHEEIPGVMKAMTMLLHVEPATLSAVKKGDVITARLTNEGGAWWLRDVKTGAK